MRMYGVSRIKRFLKCLLVVSLIISILIIYHLYAQHDNSHLESQTVQSVLLPGALEDSVLIEFYNSSDTKTDLRREILTNEIKDEEASNIFQTNMYTRLKEYRKIQNISSLLELPNPNTTTIQLESKKKIFKLGEEIRVTIQVKDGWDRNVLIGGDLLRIWMSDPKSGSNSSGYVVDHGNGSYTGVLKALWKGRATIKSSIAITKEHIGIFMNYAIENGIWYFLVGYFKKANSEKVEQTRCSTIPKIQSYKKICNFTEKNYGMSWYCGRPKSGNYTCDDWTFYSASKDNYLIKSKLIYNFLRYHKHLYIQKKISVTIGEGFLSLPKITCKERKRRFSWYDKSPVGFFNKGKWHSLLCKQNLVPNKSTYLKCLNHRPVIFLGDSASRYWFVYLTMFLNLKFTVGRWDEIKDKSWQKYAYAERKDLNISLAWAPHELPMYGDKASVKNIRSVASRLDEIPAGSNAIVLLHWYLHTARIPPDAYKEHVRNARVAVDALLARAPDVHIFIKGPHAVMYPKNFEPHDFVRLINDQIVFEEFSDLQDKVVYLSQWDMTVANENVHVHPKPEVNLVMVNELLSFVC